MFYRFLKTPDMYLNIKIISIVKQYNCIIISSENKTKKQDIKNNKKIHKPTKNTFYLGEHLIRIQKMITVNKNISGSELITFMSSFLLKDKCMFLYIKINVLGSAFFRKFLNFVLFSLERRMLYETSNRTKLILDYSSVYLL